MPLGTRETYNGVDASGTGLYTLPPVARGLTWLGLHGGDASASLRNKARLGVQGGSPVGAPVYETGHARFKGFTNYLQLPFVETPSFTAIAAVRGADTVADNAHIPVFMSSNLSSGAAGGFDLRLAAAGTLASATLSGGVNIVNGGTRTQLSRTIPALDFSRFRLIALTYDEPTRVMTLYDLTSGASATITGAVGATREASVNAVRVGSSLVSAVLGLGDVALTAFHNQALTGPELQTLYPFYQLLLAEKRLILV